ncbi:helix-turn-helix domain-containing protein [Streptomyces montanisoli]|uniref:Helix-turn-helix transcriptional regulator n=1 Tax=Streptomyces montanisoli TaxID=2798581 RepID=A0A940MGP2_9ACTN|nr:helix-turn-helix transcriptional regulator [Streptomyces montanisoli]MBP0460879.1 helix-turn-helix transcriptional regulator [Streptomyces montanisoli]
MSLQENVRSQRRTAGLTQEQLAEEADLSLSTIRKVEQGGSVSVETIHTLARALGTTTSSLFASGAPAPTVEPEGDGPKLMALRRALMPPVGLSAALAVPTEARDLTAIQRDIDDQHALYRTDRYDSVAKALPGILRSADAAVALSDGDASRRQAVVTRARALLLAGKYLTQVRRYDMAYHALARGIQGAREADDTQLATNGIVGMCWLLLRQDRFDEAEHLAAVTADDAEPRMSSADHAHLAVWGELQLRLASAAVRNNRPGVAKEARRMAMTAASALGREHVDFRHHWATFGPVTAEAKAIEDLSLIGDARGVLSRADDGPVSSKALKKMGRPSPNNWDRHRLDVARAHALLGSHQDAMDELTAIKAASPEWLKHQKMARHIVQDVLRHRKRTLTQEMRDMAVHLGITG